VGPEEAGALFERSERALAEALRLEPSLSPRALTTLRAFEVPAVRWLAIVPEERSARRNLFWSLSEEGHDAEILVFLDGVLDELEDRRLLRDAARWALGRDRPALALEIAARWQNVEKARDIVNYRPGLTQARAYLKLGDTREAYQVFRRTVSFVEAGSGGTNKAVLELLCAMGHEYLRAKQLTLAQSLFGEASALSRRYVPAALGLARTYRRQGNPAAAVREYRRALQIEPGNHEAEEALGELTLDERLKAGIR
jgi:tetratricopeptide (TPR) repeat protein